MQNQEIFTQFITICRIPVALRLTDNPEAGCVISPAIVLTTAGQPSGCDEGATLGKRSPKPFPSFARNRHIARSARLISGNDRNFNYQ
jgi:hypothetical protein